MRVAVVLLTLVCASGCRTMINGTEQSIPVTTVPDGAFVHADRCGIKQADFRSPGVVRVSRRAKQCSVTISAEGFEPVTVKLLRGYALPSDPTGTPSAGPYDGPGVAASVVLLGPLVIPCALVDWIEGAVYAQSPPFVHVNLTPTGESSGT